MRKNPKPDFVVDYYAKPGLSSEVKLTLGLIALSWAVIGLLCWLVP